MAKSTNMREKNKKFKRIGIYVFYDPEGIVDNYVVDTLSKMNPFFKKIIVVSNGNINDEGIRKIETVCHQLFIRKNRGLDAAAYKEAIVSFLGWEEVEKYDELVLVNDTFFGPVVSFQDMFQDMEKRELDFWGMSAGYMAEDGWNRVKYGYIPDHIQTFFVAFRKQMVKSDEFKNYWYNYNDNLNSFIDVVTQNEMILTKHFQDLGFKWDIYAKTEKYYSKFITEHYNMYYYNSHEMMRNLSFPILKRKVLEINMPEYLFMKDIEDPADSINYIKSKTLYDEDLIWENVLRRYNIKDLFDSLHLNYIFDSSVEQVREIKNAAIVFILSNRLYVDGLCKKVEELARFVDVYIICEDIKIENEAKKKVAAIKNVMFLEGTNQVTPMGSIFIGCREIAKKYEYMGFVADCTNPMHFPTTVTDSAVYAAVQNIAYDINYIVKILKCFSENNRLGVLGIPFSIHHNYFRNYGNEWAGWYSKAEKLKQRLQLHCNMDVSKPPLTIMDSFWCRTRALLPMWHYNWTADKFYCNPVSKLSDANETIKRLLPYVAQSEGFYSGIVMHSNYASMRLTTQQYMLDQIVGITRENLGCTGEFYAGYLQQLQTLKMSNDFTITTMNHTTNPMVIGVKGAVGIYLKKHLPNKVSEFLIRLFRLGPLPI